MKKFYRQKLKHKFSKNIFEIVYFYWLGFSELFNMKTEYEQSKIEERKLWREKLRNRLINISDTQFENNIIEKSAKFIR